ncbi:hypothetical protein EZV62_013599 [Acer yangbiense]|uniref:Uncharacterized protein n=1 Tax=Acer yangbiense TaxID=1000413 RepID=A0A5C7I0H6_9ROSI|nr:hypothetical protein EZV62_013599 [Acer yangbiense]
MVWAISGCFTGIQWPTRQTHSFQNRSHKPIKCDQRTTFSLSDHHKFIRNSENLHIRNCKLPFKRSLQVPVTLQDGYVSKPDDDNNLKSFQDFLCKNLNAFYRFSRPHTVIGTIIGITSVSLLPVETLADLSPTFFMGLFKVNKPDLPLASGDFTKETGMTIVSTFLLMLPFLRWKRHAFLAASCILIVRAIVVQLAFFIHIEKYVLGKPVVITRSLVFATAFMCFFSTVIALFKDIPDVDGDRDFGIQSFSVSLGQERVFWLCVKMLLLAYGAAIMVGASSSFLPSKLVTLFYAEYLLIPFVR